MKLQALVLASAVLLGGCEPIDLIGNADIDSWCGDVPCGWEVEGQIERVATWHSHDYAVSFESDDARISSLYDDDSAVSYSCIAFSMLAKVAPGAHAYLELDFLDDGEVDWGKRIPASDYEPVAFHVRAPEWYTSVRFIVRKDGPGEVVLAKLRATVESNDQCSGERIELDELTGGGPCDSDDNCASGECVAGFCVGCASDADCDGGRVCGYLQVGGFPTLANVLPSCVEPRTRRTGALCLGDAECDSGICCEGVCSECCGNVGCQPGTTCRRSFAADEDEESVLAPHQCDAGLHRGERGDFCTADDDCASSICGSLECTGLCGSYSGVEEDCAKLACSETQCQSVLCEVETVPAGLCE